MRKLSLAIAAATMSVPVATIPIAPAAAFYSDGYYHGTVWRDSQGRLRCKRSDGTVGLIVGAAGGALVGRAIDTHGSRATGTILGAAAGALLGREIDRSRNRYHCR
jgi:outer membrane lipoprotein SlyB